MSTMLNTGISGLSAAQVALSTVSNNISNTNTDGYSRQVVSQTDRVTQSNGRLTIGGGVDVVSVGRAYSAYLTNAVWTSTAAQQRADTYNSLATTLNSTLASGGDLQGSLDTFYGAFSAVANASGSASSRQAVLGSAGTLAATFNTFGQQLASQQQQINSQIGGTVKSINAAASDIAALNNQIRQAGANGQPNALLDQRDSLVQKLAGFVGISAVAETNGTLSVYTTAGQSLVSGSTAYALSTGNDVYDSTRTSVYDPTGTDVSQRLSGGALGALLDYRSNVLDGVQNRLGQAAIGLASSVNAQQAQGLDLNGKQGAPIFSLPAPAVLPATTNQGSGAVGVAISEPAQLGTDDYTLRFSGSTWSLQTRAGQPVPLASNPDGSYSAAGLTFTFPGTAQAGDSFRIEPARGAAAGLAVSLADPSGIAAAAALASQPAAANSGTGQVGAISVTDATDSNLLAGATVSFPTAGTYQITDAGNNVIAGGSYAPGQSIGANGFSLTLTGAPAAGDSFAISANLNGLNDNSNALALADLANKGVLNGAADTVIDAYTKLTTQIGNVGSQAATGLTTQTALRDQAVNAQQSLSGVNLDEEAASLVKFQQAYQASAQIISTAQSIFSSLLAAVQR